MTDKPARIGIVGNSFTYFNDLPKMLTMLSANSPYPIECKSATIHGAKLAQHVGTPKAEKLLDGNFSSIVLQDHSCIPGGANPKELSESLEVIENFFVQHLLKNPQHPVPALYSTWGHRDGVITSYASRFPVEAYPDYLTMQRKITAGYETYAELLRKYFPKVLVIPVGDAFEIVYHDSQSPDFKFPNLFWRLYDNVDTFHPSKIGTYLAACCFWGVYSGNSPQQLKWIPDAESTKEWDEKIFKQHGDKIQIQEVTEEVAEYLRDVAYKAVSQSKSKI